MEVIVIKQEKFPSPLDLSRQALIAPSLDVAIIKMSDAKTTGVNQGLVPFLFEVPPWE
jgi:hypothetical protein